jgi:hypothetical protein
VYGIWTLLDFWICCCAFPRPGQNLHFFFVARQLNSGFRRFLIEFSSSNTIMHLHPFELLWTSDQPFAETATYSTHNKQKGWLSLPSAGFETPIQTSERDLAFDLDRTSTRTGNYILTKQHNSWLPAIESRRHLLYCFKYSTTPYKNEDLKFKNPRLIWSTNLCKLREGWLVT